MIILTLNCGSSSAKYQVYDWSEKDVLASGVVERVTQDGSVISHKAKGKDEFVKELIENMANRLEYLNERVSDLEEEVGELEEEVNDLEAHIEDIEGDDYYF